MPDDPVRDEPVPPGPLLPPAPGRLLVATPGVGDPHFSRTVVLLLGADGDGCLGVVLNRPSRTPVEAVLPQWAAHVSAPEVLFGGGPVAPASAIGVGWCPGEPPAGFLPFAGRFGTLDLDADPAVLTVGVAATRIFAGYAGWSAGQLEQEIAAGGWYVVPAARDDVFAPAPATLYPRVLRRQGGRTAFAATAPPDPSLN